MNNYSKVSFILAVRSMLAERSSEHLLSVENDLEPTLLSQKVRRLTVLFLILQSWSVCHTSISKGYIYDPNFSRFANFFSLWEAYLTSALFLRRLLHVLNFCALEVLKSIYMHKSLQDQSFYILLSYLVYSDYACIVFLCSTYSNCFFKL